MLSKKELEENKQRENDISSILINYIPYEDRGSSSFADDYLYKIDRVFYRLDIGKEVSVQLKVRGLGRKYNKYGRVGYGDIALRSYGEEAFDEYPNIMADEVIEVILNVPEAKNWRGATPLRIIRLDINKLRNSGYEFICSPAVKTGQFILDSYRKTITTRRQPTRNGFMHTFPESLNKIIPGVYETLYTKV